MVEIIKQGKLPGEEEYTTTCRNCKTIFKFKAKEAKKHDDQRDGSYLTIVCPLPDCNTTATISPVKTPPFSAGYGYR
jgi:RNase P subunit RPR2